MPSYSRHSDTYKPDRQDRNSQWATTRWKVDVVVARRDDPGVTDDLDPREAERVRRRDHEAEAEQRALLRPGMGKVFKQIQDAQVKAAKDPPKRRRRKRD
jgi:hypothetical protein